MAIVTSRSHSQCFEAESSAAILRGLHYLYSVALDADAFAEYGSDLLWCFYFLSTRSKDRDLASLARTMGRERATQWRLKNADLACPCDSSCVFDFLYGDSAATAFGIVDRSLTKKIRAAAKQFSVIDYIGFDPKIESPPADLPDQCDCGLWNKRKTLKCISCGKDLQAMTRYAAWCDALIIAYWGEKYLAIEDARYAAVLKWLPSMRSYYPNEKPDDDDFYDLVYAITHVVYTLNDYNKFLLSPKWLPVEFEFLTNNFTNAVTLEDPEMVGEFLDTLKSFGLGNEHPLIEQGIEYLLSVQNDDGSWGAPNSKDLYLRYHPTWTAIDGLRDYAWKRKRLSHAGLFPLLLG